MEQIYYLIQGRKVTANGKDLGPADDAEMPSEPIQPGEVASPETPESDLAAQLATAQQEAREARADLEGLRQQHETVSQEADRLVGVVADLTTERDQALARVTALENITAQQLAVPEGAQLLPADARDRLIAVDGIGEATADLVLAALTAETTVTAGSEAPQADDKATGKTGDLPHNVVAAGKLKAAGITTWEGVREASDQVLTDAGLDADQLTKLRGLAN